MARSGSRYNALKQSLTDHAKSAFQVSTEDHKRLLNAVSEDKAPIIVLNIVVMEARDLEAKDSDGFSDPYCMLGIKPGVKGGHLTASRAASSPSTSPSRSKSNGGRRGSMDATLGLPSSSPKSGSSTPAGRRSPSSLAPPSDGADSDKDEVKALPDNFPSRLDKPRRRERKKGKRRPVWQYALYKFLRFLPSLPVSG